MVSSPNGSMNLVGKLKVMVVVAVDFFNHLNMLYGTVTEFCTSQEVRSAVLFCTAVHSDSLNRCLPMRIVSSSVQSCPQVRGKSLLLSGPLAI